MESVTVERVSDSETLLSNVAERWSLTHEMISRSTLLLDVIESIPVGSVQIGQAPPGLIVAWVNFTRQQTPVICTGASDTSILTLLKVPYPEEFYIPSYISMKRTHAYVSSADSTSSSFQRDSEIQQH